MQSRFVVSVLRQLVLLVGLDQQVLPNLLLRSWSVGAGVVMIAFMPTWLTEVEQGYFYTFASLLALQVFFELGMNQVVVQLVSHEAAHLNHTEAGTLDGEANRLDRLGSLVQRLDRWYSAAAFLFFLLVSVCGGLFFSILGEGSFDPLWVTWLLLTVSTATNLRLSASLAVLEGCGQISAVTRMRLVQAVIGSILTWLTMSVGGGLWAMPLLPCVAAIFSYFWIRRNGHVLSALRHRALDKSVHSHIDWRRDIFPFQWRIAVSWVSGYFIYQLFTPLAFAKLGPIEAGRLGMSLAVFGALLSVGLAWINGKVPAMAALVSRSERGSLNALFLGAMKRSMLFVLVGSVAILVGLVVLAKMDVVLVYRFSTLPVASCLAVVTVANSFIYAAAAYMRSHKAEPMMWPSIVSGVLVLVGAVVGSSYGVLTMMALYTLVGLCVALPWTLILFMGYYRRTV